MAKNKPKPESKTQKRKRYMQVVSRKRKYTRFEIEAWKKRDAEESARKALMDSIDEEAATHFSEI